MFKIQLLCLLIITVSTANTCQSDLCACSSGVCSSCLASFTYAFNNTCFICPIECATCSNLTTCLTCRPNYYLSNSSCVLCPENCQICSPACSQCINGFALVNGVCTACADANALTCQTPTTVTACNSGYWQNGNSCSPCRQFCLLCSSSSNCYSCQEGYQVSVSFGSYCSSCPSGCKTCSSSVCSQCLYNYQLLNGKCIDISQNCSQIPQCAKCSFTNSSITCHQCFYPYYISGSGCVLGSSMLCQNGSIGPMFYQCIDYCTGFGYKIDSYQNGIVCQPNSWIDSNYQYYFNSYSPIFSNRVTGTTLEMIAFDSSNSASSLLTFSLTINPFYKLQVYFKMIGINLTNQNITITYNLYDNKSNSQSKSFSSLFTNNYQPVYNNFTTKSIQDQLVTFTIVVQNNKTSRPIIGLSQLLIEVYSCPKNCRLCYNKQLCSECYGGYFNTPDNTCVTSCSGYIQLYLPNGNSANYTYKQCVLQCPSQFYTSQNNSEYICVKCSGSCITCLSDYQCLSCVLPLLYYQINYTCLGNCPNTHYNDSYICVPCVAPCQTCTSSGSCLTCSVGYLSGNRCVSVCPTGTYQNNLNNTCSACNFKCTSCMGSATYCLACNSPYLLLQSSCVLNCTNNLYYQSNATCQSCVTPCRQCTTEFDCISCSVGYLYENQCLGQCPDGYYADSFNALCQPCSNSCLTCLSSTVCLSCPNSTNLYSYACYSSCPASTYSSSNICINCLLPCANCLNQSFCVSCSVGYLSQESFGSCVNSCEEGYYGYALNRSCLSCTNNCSTCSGTSYLCLSCPTNLLLQNSACVQNCASGLFNLSGSCYSCTYPCLTCINSDDICTSCYSSYILINSTCETECPLNTFSSNYSCLPCQYPCQTCFSTTGCLSCSSNSTNQTFLFDSSCIITCPSSTFADTTSLTCMSCLYPCQNCISEERCLSCASGYLVVSTGTCSMCSDTMFANETSRQCQSCQQSIDNCLMCASSSQCTQCLSNYYLFNSSCITAESCLAYTYFYVDKLLQGCNKCLSPCKTCLNSSYCNSCSTGYLLNGNCLTYCPSNYYQSSNACFQCLLPCLTCSDTTKCLTCNSSSQYNVLLVANYTCIQSSDCQPGNYLSQNVKSLECVKCTFPCLTCANATYCLSCYSGLLVNGNCKSLCPSSYYANTLSTNNTVCSSCSTNCFKCAKSATFCTACYANYYLRNNTCVSSCGNGFYLDQTVLECFACLSPCGNCSSLSTCLDCINSSYILYYGECLTSCPDGSYSNGSTCYTCPTSCLTCTYFTLSNSIQCNSCNFGLFMSTKTEGLCIANCSSNQYSDIVTRNCYSCIAPCQSCTDAIHCLSCIQNYLLYQKQCLKISRCPDGSYLLNKSCITNCGDLWAAPSSASCIEDCQPLFLKVYQNSTKQCLNGCPNNYRVVSNYTCLSCTDGGCSNLLGFELQYKNIFNILYLKLTFNKQIQGSLFQSTELSISLDSNTPGRMLSQPNVNFSVAQINLDAIWLKLSINQTLRSATLTLLFSDYYIFAEPLQSLTYNIIITEFDYYSSDEMESAGSWQKFSEALSIFMVLLFALNLFLNSGHLSYSIIDYYQLLFMVLFLSIDFPPQLNNFLYGFRYSHYLFLPQIFRGSAENVYTTSTPDQFGVIVPDVNFINNTGHDFIIIFVTVGILLICKAVEIIVEKTQCLRSNKVSELQGPSDEQLPNQEKNETCIVRFVKAIISRFKWNYFNDIIYSIYFSLMLFSFSQLYDLEWKSSAAVDLVSILLAFFFLILGIFFPFFLGWFLHKNEKNLIQHSLEKQKEEYLTIKKKGESAKYNVSKEQEKENKVKSFGNEQSVHRQDLSQPQEDLSSNNDQLEISNKYQILTDYKCFLSGIKLKVRLGFYQVPIRYIKKLILAALLVYCSQYPSFVLGVIMMLCFINILITLLMKPFRLSFQQIVSPIFDGIYLVIFFIICVMQLPLLNLTKSQKLTASYAAIALCTLLSILLAIYNIIMNVVQIIKYFWKVDYFSKFYQTEYVSTSEESDHLTDHGTNTPIKKQPIQEQQMTGSQIFSGLDIYLKKESTAPKYLIKCVKKEEEDQEIKGETNQEIIVLSQVGDNIRESHDKMANPRRSTYEFIENNNKEMIQKLVKGIQPMDFEQEDQSSYSQEK